MKAIRITKNIIPFSLKNNVIKNVRIGIRMLISFCKGSKNPIMIENILIAK